MANCPNCGLSVEDGKKFCSSCGTKMPVLVHQKICKVCGNSLNSNASFCNVCGTPVPKDAVPVEVQEPQDFRNPTMDEIAIPVLNDETPALQEKPLTNNETPTMDSIFMPGQQPVQQAQPAMSATANSAPIPEQQTMAERKINIPPTPTVASTPLVNEMPYQQNTQVESVITPDGQRIPANNGIPTQNGANYIPNNTNEFNNNNFNQQMQGVTPGKGAKALIPILLIILIIGVIVFDVFFLFKDQIFGKKADTKVTASIVTLDDTFYNTEE